MTYVEDLKEIQAFSTNGKWSDCEKCNGTGYVEGSAGEEACWSCFASERMSRHLQALARWRRICPTRFAGYRLDTHPNQAAADAVREWMPTAVERGANLFLAGTVGSGKTGMAIGALREMCIQHDRTILHGSVPSLLEGMRPQRDGDAPGTAGLRDLQRVNILLLDDLGVEKASEWQAERLYMIVNDRYERQLPTIMTTNMNRKDLESRVGERVMSRLMEDVQVVQMGGDDLRKRGA